MSAQQTPAHSLSVRPKGNIIQKRFVTWTGLQAGANANSCGIADENGVQDGPVIRVICLGTGIVDSGAILDGTETRVQSDATGRAVPFTTGPALGRLVPGQTAAAAGVPVEIFLIPN